MRISFLSFYLGFFLLLPFSILAQHTRQHTQQENTEGSFNHLTVTVGMSTLGFTAEATTPLLSNLILKGGISTYDYNTTSHAFHLNDPYGVLKQAFGQEVSYTMKAQAKNVHGHLVVDYFPIKKGWIYLSGGFYFGQTKLSAKGIITNRDGSPAQLQAPYDWPQLEFNGQKLDITNGQLNAELTLGNTIKPYIGFGLGRAVPKRRLGIKAELGILFAGEYSLKQNGINIDRSLTAGENFEKVNSYLRWFKYYPMAKLQINYRIF